MAATKPELTCTASQEAYVFGNAIGEVVHRDRMGARWRATCDRAKVVGLHFHDLRHEAGSRLLKAGAKLHEVQAIPGHTNIHQTSTYLNASTHGLEEAMEKLRAAEIRRAMHAVAC